MEAITTSNALSFDVVSDHYTKVRPGYPPELYDLVAQYKNFTCDSHILEIGAGQGVATREIYAKWQPYIIAIEPGANFCDLLRSAFSNNPKITIIQGTFELSQVVGRFDAIFSATAFHWCDPQTKYQRAAEHLQKDGLLVVYWNYYSTSQNAFFEAIQQVYVNYGFAQDPSKSGDVIRDEKIAARKHEFQSSPSFELLKDHLYTRVFDYDAEQYGKLLMMFPDHTSTLRNREDLERFLNAIKDIIYRNHDTIRVDVTTSLFIGRRKG